MAIYLKIGDIKGDVTADQFQDQIELESFSFGVSRDVSMEAGNIRNREVGLPYIQSIACSKQLDASTPMLLQNALTGAATNDAEISIVRTGDKGGLVVVGVIKLTNVMVADYSFNGVMGAKPAESLSISFSEIEVDFAGADTDGKNGSNIKVGYDLAAAKPK
jgi:type VI secretion system secreted protein Hcp